MANFKLQLLRNTTTSVFDSFDQAKAHLSADDFVAARKDGELIAVRYMDNFDIKSAGAIYHVNLNGENGVTFLSDLSNVDALVGNMVEAIGLNDDGTYVADTTTGSIISTAASVLDADKILAAAIAQEISDRGTAINNLNLTQVYTEGKAIVKVSQSNGVVSAEAGEVAAEYVTVADAENVITATNLEDALTELAKKINKNQVSNADGSIAVDTTGTTTDVKLKVKSGEKIIKVDATNGVYTDIGLEKVTTGLATNVKEAYRLTDSNGAQIGEQINVYKDSSLNSVELAANNGSKDGQFLKFSYTLDSGEMSIVYLDVSTFLVESEFKNGLTVNSAGEVSVLVDPASEYLSVTDKGIKVTGISDAISGISISASGDNYVSASVDATDKKKIKVSADVQTITASAGTRGTYSVSETGAVTISGETAPSISGVADSLADGSDIASKVKTYVDAKVDAEAAARTAFIDGAIKALDSTATATAVDNNKYYVLTGITIVDGKISSKTEVKLAAVAYTGKAADVSVEDTEGKLTSTNVESALNEIVVKADASLNSVSGSNAITVGTKDTNKDQSVSLKLDTVTNSNDNALTISTNGLYLSSTIDCGTY